MARVVPTCLALILCDSVRFTLDFVNPNAVLEHDARLEDGIELEKVGRYRLRLEADGITIIQRYFVARQAS